MADTWTFPDLPGWVENRSGKASSRWRYEEKQYRKTHPFPFLPKNYRTVHLLHRQFVEDIVAGRTGRRASRKKTLHSAIDEYFTANAATITAASRKEIDVAFGYYFDVDMALNEETLYRHLLLRQQTPPPPPAARDGRPVRGRKRVLNPNTRRKYLGRVGQFFAWCIRRGYLKSNPADMIARPERRERDNQFFTPEEIDRLIGHHLDRAREHTSKNYSLPHIFQARFIELAFLLGTRPSELIRLRWEDVEPDRIKIFGKARPSKGNTRTRREIDYPRLCRDENARIRWVSLPTASELDGPHRQWRSRIDLILEEMRPYRKKFQGWVFPFKRTQTVNVGLQEAKAALYDNPKDLERDGRTFRNLRNSAVWYYEHVLGVHPYTSADYLGHSPAVSWNDYRPTTNPEDLKKRMVEASRRQNPDDPDSA